MKLKIFAYILMLAAVALTGCSKDNPANNNDSDSIPDNNIPNIQKADVPSEPSGGDPRGTYFANEPYYIYIDLSTNSTTQVFETSNKAKLMYKFEGSSSASGTYTFLKDFIDVQTTRVRTTMSAVDTTTKNIIEKYNPIKKSEGTWKVSADTLFLYSGGVEAASRFTADNKGLYFIDEIQAPFAGHFKEIYVYKK